MKWKTDELFLADNNLINFHGLENLIRVGYFSCRGNFELKSLEGLNKNMVFERGLVISENGKKFSAQELANVLNFTKIQLYRDITI